MEYTDDVLQNFTVVTYIILLTNVTSINLIKIFKSTYVTHILFLFNNTGQKTPSACQGAIF